MTIALLIATCFSLGFFIESIIGFGGGMIAYATLGFFMNIKEMILVGLYIGTLSSAAIIFSDYKKVSKKIFFSSIPICFLGSYVGVNAFTAISLQFMTIALGAMLIVLSIKTIFFDNIKVPKYYKNSLLLTGGISHGLFGIGGPFFVNALKPEFKSKSELRVTLALFFVTFNLVRFFKLTAQGDLDPGFFLDIWWTVIPVFFTIYLGFKVHVKIDEKLFRKGLSYMTLFAGTVFLFK